MVLKFFGILGTGQGQLEDQLFEKITKRGLSRHSPHDLAALINNDYGKFGIRDDFKQDATHAQVKEHLNKGFPVIVHGWFTQSGHIIVIVGYDDKAYGGRGAYIVNDPYGEYFPKGYDTRASGKGLLYSYPMMKELAGNDGDFWVHFVSSTSNKKKK